MATVQEPKRIISSRIVARRLGISHNTIAKHIRRELFRPDYQSDSGLFFDPARLPQLKQAIAENRQRNWPHVCAAT
jgi:IS30 family transposase